MCLYSYFKEVSKEVATNFIDTWCAIYSNARLIMMHSSWNIKTLDFSHISLHKLFWIKLKMKLLVTSFNGRRIFNFRFNAVNTLLWVKWEISIQLLFTFLEWSCCIIKWKKFTSKILRIFPYRLLWCGLYIM